MALNITRSTDFDRCFAIRRAVFIDEQNVPEEIELDEHDAEALHYLACDGDTPIGTARIVLHAGQAKIGRVCVLKPSRGTGAGAALMRAMLADIRVMPGVHEAVLGAQTHAVGFYEALGFEAFGPLFDDAGIPHRNMRLVL